ncbi:hypothetical protein H4R35_005697 [Dimargaris xerosporica]|nr:hypothetical protein H4R35_005697 [Dimargaris xerosporica]
MKDSDGFKSIGHMMQQDPRTFMYFAVNTEHNVLAVVVEGSVESRENYENFDVLLTRWPFASSSKAKVHRGYYGIFNSVKDGFYNKLAGYMIKYPKYTPWLIGHSRGAVVITLLLASIVSTCPQPFTRLMCDRLQQTATLTIFGSPRIGTRAFADHLLDLNIAIQRVTNVIEETPRLPPKALGYLHINNEWWYDGNTLWQCAPSERYETTACNGGTTFSFKNGHPYHLAVLGKPANPGYPEQSNQPLARAVLA